MCSSDLLYLYTDDACTYQFYEHRGFERVEEKEIVLEMPKGKVPLRCFVYSKKMEGSRRITHEASRLKDPSRA